MPLQNRISPFAEIVATPARGTFMGNRGGRIHDPENQSLLKRRWASRHWIVCVLKFKQRRRQVMRQGYTELFFLDEVTALAAGHRPCFECQRQRALAFFQAHAASAGLTERMKVPEFDRLVHHERLDEHKRKRTFQNRLAGLPDGAVIVRDEAAWAVRSGLLLRWSFSGYTHCLPIRQNDIVDVLTPPVFIAILTAGYRPVWHHSADRLTKGQHS